MSKHSIQKIDLREITLTLLRSAVRALQCGTVSLWQCGALKPDAIAVLYKRVAALKVFELHCCEYFTAVLPFIEK